MNILVPDSWLRDYLKTKATPKQLKDCLSLCGPSVERINTVEKDIVYDIEITGNRPDMMSVSGVAREASVILPRFDIPAEFLNDPYIPVKPSWKINKHCRLSLSVDATLCPRFMIVVLEGITNNQSPKWMQAWLTLSGMRPINTVVDITNYLMKAFGQPTHAFDYDQILPNKNGIPTMKLRASKKGENITTLDGKLHTLPGGDIVMEDGSGRLIDLCGIMGGSVSHITDQTTRIALFVQNYDPSHIRKTSMALAHRTDAAGLFEKGLDPELVKPTCFKGIELLLEYAEGKIASEIYDLYPKPFIPYTVSVSREKANTYIGTTLEDREIKDTLIPLGLQPAITENEISVTVPSFRRDIIIDVDIIEEIARIYGYHNIKTKLPDTEPPMVFENPILHSESEINHMLKGWGYTEILTYSMLSQEQMDLFKFPTDQAYAITNPLSSEWIYMRPSLLPGLLTIIKQNSSVRKELSLFELSMIYQYRVHDIPQEVPILTVGKTGAAFSTLKGIAETIYSQYGIPLPKDTGIIPSWYNVNRSLTFGDYGIIGELAPEFLEKMGITQSITVLELNILKLHAHKQSHKTYMPIPKYPPSFEDIAVTVQEKTLIGPMIIDIKKAHPLITDVTVLDIYEQTRTFHITFQSVTKNLTAADITPIREKILSMLSSKYQAHLKTA